MSENRRQILDMLAQGKINADEAERLLKALEREPGTGDRFLRSAAQRPGEISAGGRRCP